jgi:hypothetical protein
MTDSSPLIAPVITSVTGPVVLSLTGALSELDPYAVLGFKPEFVSDFINEYYRTTSGKQSTLADAITHARAGNATMTDGYGPELVTNGGFDSDLSGWTDTNSHWSVVDGRAYHASSSAYNPLSLTLSLSGTYILTFDAEVISASDTAHLLVDGTSTQLLANGSDSYSLFITDATTIVFSREPGSTAEFYIDNVSVREMPVIKWAPHNLLTYSEDFSNSAWTKDNVTVLDSTITDSITVSGLHAIRQSTALSGNAFDGQQITVEAELKAGTKRWAWLMHLRNTAFQAFFDLENGVVGTASSGCSASMTATTDGKYICRLSLDAGNAATGTTHQAYVGLADADNNRNYNGDGTGTIECYGVWSYRSDLGGMVDNPDQPASRASYVPTTSAAKYLPRIGHHVYNGSAWVNEGVLAESESRTNLLTYSQDFTQWTNENSDDLADQASGPDGNTSMAFFSEDSSSGRHIIYVTLSGSLNVTRTFSVYVKKPSSNGRRYVALSVPNGGDSLAYSAIYDLDTGLVSATKTNGTATIAFTSMEDVGGGIYRCVLSGNSNSATTAPFYPMIALSDRSDFTGTLVSNNMPSYTGDGTSGVYIYGAQLEEASTPSSLIPTSGSTVSRAAESFTIPSANLPWPTPQYIGDNVVTNGTFDSDVSGWSTAGGTVSLSSVSGELEVDGDANTFALQNISLTAGKVYRLTGTARLGTHDGSVRVYIGTSFSVVTSTENTDVDIIYVATSSSANINLRLHDGVTGGTAYFDSISVREINPLSVSIGMEGRMTYADTNNAEEVHFLVWQADGNNRLRTRLNTSTASRTGKVDIQQKANGSGWESASGNTEYSPDVLVPYNIAQRNGSTFVQGASNGVAFTANTTPTALPDLSAQDLTMGSIYMGTIGTFRVWDKDLGDAGLVEATNPSLEPSLSLTFEGTGTNSFVVNNWSE